MRLFCRFLYKIWQTQSPRFLIGPTPCLDKRERSRGVDTGMSCVRVCVCGDVGEFTEKILMGGQIKEKQRVIEK